MPAIKYRVPYEVRVRAGDLSTGKPVSNVFYLKTAVQLTSPPAYGATIAGSGSTTTLLNNFATAFVAGPLTMMASKYVLTGYEMRSLEGWKFGGATLPIIAVGVGNPTTIQVFGTSGLVNGDLVSVQGVTGATNANGIWPLTVTAPNKFTIPANTSAQLWSGGGTWQSTQGEKQWIYGDVELKTASNVGGIADEAVALFATASVRRLSTSAGKSWQGRNSYSPIPESTVESGAFTTAAKASWSTALAQLEAPVLNGGSENPGSGQSYPYNVSKLKAFSQVSPFAESFAWTALVTNMVLQPDMGTLLRRKPRLTSVITP